MVRVLLKLWCAQGLPRNLVGIQILRACSSDKFPGERSAAQEQENKEHRVWLPDQQHWQQLRTCYRCKFTPAPSPATSHNYWLRNFGGRVSNSCLTKPPRWFWWKLKFNSHWHRGKGLTLRISPAQVWDFTLPLTVWANDTLHFSEWQLLYPESLKSFLMVGSMTWER